MLNSLQAKNPAFTAGQKILAAPKPGIVNAAKQRGAIHQTKEKVNGRKAKGKEKIAEKMLEKGKKVQKLRPLMKKQCVPQHFEILRAFPAMPLVWTAGRTCTYPCEEVGDFEDFQHSLTLAHGKTMCSCEVERLGVPGVCVLRSSEGDDIDLFPECCLWERGCAVVCDAGHTIKTPRGRVVQMKM